MWTEIAQAHPEFFRVSPEETGSEEAATQPLEDQGRISLLGRSAAGGSDVPPLHELIRIALELHKDATSQKCPDGKKPKIVVWHTHPILVVLLPVILASISALLIVPALDRTRLREQTRHDLALQVIDNHDQIKQSIESTGTLDGLWDACIEKGYDPSADTVTELMGNTRHEVDRQTTQRDRVIEKLVEALETL